MHSSSPEKSSTKSLNVADITACGWQSEQDPLAAANAHIAGTYYFVRDIGGKKQRLQIGVNALRNAGTVNIRITDGSKSIAEEIYGDPIVHRETNAVKPEDALSTIQHLSAEMNVISENASTAAAVETVRSGQHTQITALENADPNAIQ